MKLLDLLTEDTNEPRIRYFGILPDGYNGSPEDHKMIKKMKQVYKALSKGRGRIQLFLSMDGYPPLDVSYNLPPLENTVFLITYPNKKQITKGAEIEYLIDVAGKVKYTFHNLETQKQTNPIELMKTRNYDVSFVYKKKFDKFGILISA